MQPFKSIRSSHQYYFLILFQKWYTLMLLNDNIYIADIVSFGIRYILDIAYRFKMKIWLLDLKMKKRLSKFYYK